jgi:hypothetical protein
LAPRHAAFGTGETQTPAEVAHHHLPVSACGSGMSIGSVVQGSLFRHYNSCIIMQVSARVNPL